MADNEKLKNLVAAMTQTHGGVEPQIVVDIVHQALDVCESVLCHDSSSRLLAKMKLSDSDVAVAILAAVSETKAVIDGDFVCIYPNKWVGRDDELAEVITRARVAERAARAMRPTKEE